MTNKLKIVVVDDHPLFLGAMAQVLENIDFVEVLAKYTKPEFVLPFIKTNNVDILVTDLSMPNISGLDLCKLVKSEKEDIKVVVVSMLNEVNKTLELIEMGVSAYLSKNAPKEDYEKVLKLISEGKTFFSKEITEKVNSADQIESIKLTPREKEVLILVANELTNQEIATELFVSITTVISHRKRLIQKFNARNTAGLIKRAMEQNFL